MDCRRGEIWRANLILTEATTKTTTNESDAMTVDIFIEVDVQKIKPKSYVKF